MPRYHDVISAAGETATKILAQRTRIPKIVTVTCNGGETASVTWCNTDDTVMLNMPNLPPDTMLTRAEADRMVGYIAHECCHVIHTDWNAWMAAVREGDKVRSLVNCLEDVRIERTEIRAKHYPALRTILASLMTQKHAEALVKAKAQGVTIGDKVAHFPYVLAVLGRVANGYSVPTAHTLARDLSAPVRQIVEQGLAGLPSCRSTRDCLDLALRLLTLADELEAEADNQGAPQGAQDGQGEPQGEPQDGQGAQDGQGEPQGAQDGQGEPQDGQREPQDGQGEPQGAQDGQGEPQDGQDGQGEPQGGQDGPPGGTGAGDPFDQGAEAIDPDDMADMVKAAGERYGAKELEASRESFAHLLPMARNTVQRSRNARGYWNANAVRVLQEPLKSTSVLHGQLARLLVSDEKSARTHYETSGRLDRRALVRMRTGAPDVFSQRQDAPAVQTALIVLVDESGSMASLAHFNPATGAMTSRMELARCTAWAIARAAEDAGAKVSVIGFTSLPNAMPHDGAVLHVAKDFDEPCSTAAASIARMAADQTTPMSPAIMECARIISGVPATRRIIMVITDGACNYRAATVRAACVIAADDDVEVVGVGMACGSVIADAFPAGYSVNVDNLDQLATTGLGTLVRMLEERE